MAGVPFTKAYLKREVMSEYKENKGEGASAHEKLESKRKELAEKKAVKSYKMNYTPKGFIERGLNNSVNRSKP